jgi:hypothetical protein
MPHHELSHPSRAPASPSLTFAVDFEELLRTQVENLLSDWGVQWAVLGVLRQFYTLREGRITSKTKAGEYGGARRSAITPHGFSGPAMRIDLSDI